MLNTTWKLGLLVAASLGGGYAAGRGHAWYNQKVAKEKAAEADAAARKFAETLQAQRPAPGPQA